MDSIETFKEYGYHIHIPTVLQQLYPNLPIPEVHAWFQWVVTQPNYKLYQIQHAGCVVKVYNQIDPPWLRVAQEVAWWGHGRDAVRVLHRGMDWARLQGATLFGYSLAPHYDRMRWRTL